MKETKTLEIKPIKVNSITVSIVGDGDIILNKMNDVTTRELTDKQKNKSKSVEEKNEWEQIITAMHWRDGKPTDYSEKGLKDALKNNAPCITAFGLKKSFEEAIVRNGIDTYATKFRNSVNVVAENGLIPIKFYEHYVDEKLMSPKRGAPVLTRQNRFTGWTADVVIQYIEGGAYSVEQILQIVGLAGFGGGIGSGRSSGYGRYHVASVNG